ncbi:hypothetical protein EYF80_029647 [Liparis tanakae]|uniref:Uncharacterized protein n=1 Tax=Liparis tanakae TaxID=230148 RepID=A0A4Z2H481_9TELE|nr:hypothetical protein EYF80_029647 [Liparis tanakae]
MSEIEGLGFHCLPPCRRWPAEPTDPGGCLVGPWRSLLLLLLLSLLHRPNPGECAICPRQDYTVHWAKKSSSAAD